MLKGAILYYSNTGNTRLACEYMAAKTARVRFDLIDIVRSDALSLEPYDVVGFAFFTDTWRPPELFMRRVSELRDVQDKPVFSLNTYGFLTGNSARIMCRALRKQGMIIVGAHSLHTPENYPPMIAGGHGFPDSPNEKEMTAFNAFICQLDFTLGVLETGKTPISLRPYTGILNALLPGRVGQMISSRAQMHAEPSLCVSCGICAAACPAGAVALSPHAVIDGDRCTHCWSCYNHCPNQAIHTGRFTGQGQYPHPPESYLKKLSAPGK